jgi:hypothetical protein
VPEEILTISGCIDDDVPRPDRSDWYLDHVEAERARRQQAPHSRLVTVAMAVEDAEEFMAAVSGDEAPRGVRGDDFDLLRRWVPLSDDVTILGFEIVGAESCLSFHSWHCHGYADEVADALDVRTNRDGLIPTRPAARSALDWMLSRPTDESPMAVPWTVVALATIGPP